MKYLITIATTSILLLGLMGSASAVSYVDIIFVADQSGSMDKEFKWIGNNLTTIGTEITNCGIEKEYDIASCTGDIFTWTDLPYIKAIILISEEDALVPETIDSTIYLNVIGLISLYSVWYDAFFTKCAYSKPLDLNNAEGPTTGFSETNITEIGENAPVPEPATLILFISGLLGMAAITRRRTT